MLCGDSNPLFSFPFLLSLSLSLTTHSLPLPLSSYYPPLFLFSLILIPSSLSLFFHFLFLFFCSSLIPPPPFFFPPVPDRPNSSVAAPEEPVAFLSGLCRFLFFFSSKKIHFLVLLHWLFFVSFLYRWLHCSVHGSTALDNTHPPTTSVACFQLPLRLVAPPISAVDLPSRFVSFR